MNSILNNPRLRGRVFREGLLDAEACTLQENERYQALVEAGEALPDGIYPKYETPDEFMRVIGEKPTVEEERNLMLALQTRDIKTIRSWVTYFGIISVISLIITFFALFVR